MGLGWKLDGRFCCPFPRGLVVEGVEFGLGSLTVSMYSPRAAALGGILTQGFDNGLAAVFSGVIIRSFEDMANVIWEVKVEDKKTVLIRS